MANGFLFGGGAGYTPQGGGIWGSQTVPNPPPTSWWDRFSSDPNNMMMAAQVLGQLGGGLLAAGAPSTDPGHFGRTLGATMQGIGPQMDRSQYLRNQGRLTTAKIEEIEAQRRQEAAKAQAVQGLLGQGPQANTSMMSAPMVNAQGANVGGGPAANTPAPQGLLGGMNPQQQQYMGVLAQADPDAALKMTGERLFAEPKDTPRQVIGNDIYERDPATNQWTKVLDTPPDLSPRDQAFAGLTPAEQRQVLMKPQVQIGGAYKPQTDIAKLEADKKYLMDGGYAKESPQIRAIERKIAETGRPSGELMRTREMVESGQRTMKQITDTLMPDGKVDRNAMTSMYAALPGTDGRTTRSQFEEAAALMLRLETGAAATASEVQNLSDRYMPKPWDNDETIRDKIQRFQSRFDRAKAILEGKSVEDLPADEAITGAPKAKPGRIPRLPPLSLP